MTRMIGGSPAWLLVCAACAIDTGGADADDTDDLPPVIDCTTFCADTLTDAATRTCYSCQCKAAMDGWLPSVDELQCANGEEIVVYTAAMDGSLTRVDTATSTCANPSLLYGTCAPGGRLGRIAHGSVTAMFICRRNYSQADLTDPTLPFDDVGVILYNSRNGASCWFDDMDGTGIAARNMPDLDLTKRDPENELAFLRYFYYSEGEGCVGCHDNDPFVYTPYLQSVNWPAGVHAQAAFQRVTLSGALVPTGNRRLVSPEAAACTSCHRIASGGTCGAWAPDSYGVKGAAHEARVAEAASDPESPLWWLGTWMPYTEGIDPIKDREAWESTYGEARDTVASCCQQPGLDTPAFGGNPACVWDTFPGDPDPDTDTDPDTDPWEKNLLQSAMTGGDASVVAITAVDGVGAEDPLLVYNADLTVGCAADWGPQGALCDESLSGRGSDTRTNVNSGATWVARDGAAAPTTGVLVIDACATGRCESVTFDEGRVFQMFSDGKTTHVRLSGHATRAESAPPWDDAGWSEIVAWTPVSAGATTDLGITVTDPTILPTPSTQTRYLRVEVQNDGAHGQEGYVELRSLKLFAD